MLKLKRMKEQQAAAAAAKEKEEKMEGDTKMEEAGSSASAEKPKKSRRANAAELVAQKDINEMDEVPGVKVDFPDPDNLMVLKVEIKPPEGYYKGGTFVFSVNVPDNYPFTPPKVRCDTLVYHPNIDFEGGVCLNILREDWTPVLNLGSVIFGLLTLFSEPNPDDPLNKEAANLMEENLDEFVRNVKQSLRGGYVEGRRFPKHF
eukprot:CAMPEP_0119122692 /NCGR_PEP_ID=MMETSP1310-20130426/2878_1 /TAXON_ID=464262 /ORGANISM="Genus nov. species nov., Strain RCC2339" /LENGTH=203 /DNA_ID=CAMNT_0007112391 /DNA_START=78 /DNA_END=689 /DNA_ORIENTATION=-